MRRRDAAALLPLLVLPPVRASTPARLAAAWVVGHRWQVGWLLAAGGHLQVAAALDVPTRAHGLWLDAQGRLLAAARRPGDWLLRWDGAAPAQWHWGPADRQFNGHVVTLGERVLTTATDLATGEGRIGVHDAATLDLVDDWPSGGRDPHQLLPDGEGGLWVANGGLETRAETGRMKHALDTMDASLRRLDGRGRSRGHWTLADRRLSIRHLAALPGGGVAVALQAEHDDPAERQRAPVLALCDGRTLRPVAAPVPLGGYGGDVACVGDEVWVSCPRAPVAGGPDGGRPNGGVGRWDRQGRWRGLQPLPEANALAAAAAGAWAGGHPQAMQRGQSLALAGVRLDNHWRIG